MLFLSQLFVVKMMIHPTVVKSHLEQEQVQNLTVKRCVAPLGRQFLLQLLFPMFKKRDIKVKMQWFLH